MILSSYRYWGQVWTVSERRRKSVVNFVPLHSWLRAPASMNEFQQAYITAKEDTQNGLLEMFVSPFAPDLWGDLWQIRIHFDSGPGSLAALTEFLDSVRMKILMTEGAEGETGTFNSIKLIVSAEAYETRHDGVSSTRRVKDFVRLWEFENRLSFRLIDNLDFPNGLTPRVYVRRLGQYNSLWRDWKMRTKDDAKRISVFESRILPSPERMKSIQVTGTLKRNPQQHPNPYGALKYHGDEISDPGLWLSAEVMQTFQERLAKDSRISPRDPLLVFPSVDTSERFLRITLCNPKTLHKDHAADRRIHHFGITLPHDRSLLARVYRRISKLGLNVVKFQVRPGIDIEDLAAITKKNADAREKTGQGKPYQSATSPKLEDYAQYCRLDITCVSTNREDDETFGSEVGQTDSDIGDAVADRCYREVRDAVKRLGQDIIFVSLHGSDDTLVKQTDLNDVLSDRSKRARIERDAVQSAFGLFSPEFPFAALMKGDAVAGRAKPRTVTQSIPLSPDDEFLMDVSAKIELIHKSRMGVLGERPNHPGNLGYPNKAALQERTANDVAPDGHLMRERFLRYLLLRHQNLPFRGYNKKVFVSRSGSGAKLFVKATERLLQLGYTPSDGFDLQHGPAVGTAILSAIQNAELFLGIWTAEDAQIFSDLSEKQKDRSAKDQAPSPWMPFELGMAIAAGKPYALLIEDTIAISFMKIVPHTPHFFFTCQSGSEAGGHKAPRSGKRQNTAENQTNGVNSFDHQLDRAVGALIARFNMTVLGDLQRKLADD